jgi:hypothetical protein
VLVAVDRRGRGIDHLGHLGSDARLEQALRRQNVVARIDLERAAPATADARLGGEVEDAVDVRDER